MNNHSPFLKLAKPAQRALQNAGIDDLEQLSKYTETEIAKLHGIGKNAILLLRQELNKKGLSFQQE
ncbi:MAG: hypothetical protein CL609_05105 [Anaerolineaceae bacterium]|nr:hypothetical protein [Anaerolineaceae bacterium]